MFTAAYFALSGKEDQLISETAGFDYKDRTGSCSRVHVRFTAEHIESKVCSYAIRLVTSIRSAGNPKRVPITFDIGFMDRYPDMGALHRRHAFLYACADEAFLRKLIRSADTGVFNTQRSKLDVYMRIADADVHNLCVRVACSSGGTIVFSRMSKPFMLDHLTYRSFGTSETLPGNGKGSGWHKSLEMARTHVISFMETALLAPVEVLV